MVRARGLEPPRIAALEPKSSVSTIPPCSHMVPPERFELPSADYKSAAKPSQL